MSNHPSSEPKWTPNRRHHIPDRVNLRRTVPGNSLLAMRKQLGLTAADVSEWIGSACETVYSWEKHMGPREYFDTLRLAEAVVTHWAHDLARDDFPWKVTIYNHGWRTAPDGIFAPEDRLIFGDVPERLWATAVGRAIAANPGIEVEYVS